MRPFLHHTAQHLWNLYGEQLSDLKIVFPNKRSLIYFKKYLKEFATDYFIVPECLIINDLIVEQSRKVVADKLTLRGKLYKSFKKFNDTNESFSEFYPFANLLLGDFDTIDKHLVDTQQLFKNIASLQAIDDSLSYLTEEQIKAIKQFWKSFDIEEHSKHQQMFLQMWKALPKVYEDFNETLDEEGIAYEGRIFREVAEALKRGETTLADRQTVFIGFNVLSKAEREIFRLLKEQDIATFYWDYDVYYIDNRFNEAGRFISRNISDFPNPETFVLERGIDSQKNVKHIECATEVQQTKVLGEILKDISPEELKKSVVVLANEDLLVTVLSSLPETLDEVNISMGYPLKETPWMQFLELWVSLHRSMIWQDDTAFFSSDIIQKILHHPYASHFDKDEVKTLERKMRESNKMWVTAESISGKLSKMLSPIVKQEECYLHLKRLLSFLYTKTEAHSADRELMLRTSTLSRRMHDVLLRVDIKAQQFFWTILLEELTEQRMPFETSIEENLQIIGFLETRLLDFKNVYILSANENYLPNIQLAGSLIPYNLRIGAGLPTLDEQNSMYAYYFYRLLSRAETMTLFSVSGTEDMQTKEQSRYITQLKFEAPFVIDEMVASVDLKWVPAKPQEIVKDETVLGILSQKYFIDKKPISASAINRYLRCPQNFYYRYIKGVQEVQSLAKADDNNMFGSIFHKAAELLYKPYLNEEISTDLLNQIGKPKNLEKVIFEAFQIELFAGEERELRGKEWLIFDTLKHLLKKLINRDKNYAPFRVVGLEESMQASLQFETNGQTNEVVLGGLIDRIDEKDGVVRVVDYKTGYINRGFRSLEELFEATGKYRNPTALQTIFYSWLFYQNTGEFAEPCVYHLKDIETVPKTEFGMGEGKNKPPFSFAEHHREYESLLQKVLGDIFGNEPVFFRSEDDSECSHDSHTGICTVFSGN
ncbi:PD-(D/E)XK nuclease superfamily protein [Balneicella halophila]|uniref:PD-(D/E)XK nuclease superfamily protein n=1 Tax=Balneicella halophila TaxID=1537566 RepID=A0A7L4UN45_BALHA|nr:PD-(D/E)XK nuclease family protein [Balneicella halophila]PVX50051.1 PD-(D/E)XK nuclease superfamily protein [Balneicella halophila]